MRALQAHAGYEKEDLKKVRAFKNAFVYLVDDEVGIRGKIWLRNANS
jgi:hypothetical protein